MSNNLNNMKINLFNENKFFNKKDYKDHIIKNNKNILLKSKKNLSNMAKIF